MNEREFVSRIEAEFVKFLLTRGYSEDSIIYEPAALGVGGRMYRPDFLLIDPVRNEKLAIVEVKGILPHQNVKVQLEKYKKALGGSRLQAFVVVPDETDKSPLPFSVYVFNASGEAEQIKPELFPTFRALASNTIAEQKQATLDGFDRLCWGLAVCSALLAIADFILERRGIELLTTVRLWLVGGSLALALGPYTQKFKGPGFEWERRATREK